MTTNHYELVFLVAPDLPEEKRQEITERTAGYLTSADAVLESLDLWEKRTLAYPIQKHREAYYYVAKFSGPGKAVDEIERRFRVMEGVLRFLAIRKDEEDKVSEKRKAYYQAKRQQLEKKRKSGDTQPRERGRSRQDEGVRE